MARLRLILAFIGGLTSQACEREPVGPPALPVVTVTIAPDHLTLPIGASATLEATVRNADGQTLPDRTIVWTSSAAGIASVSSAGVVTALEPGTATITAYSEPGLDLVRVVVHEDFRLPLPSGRHWLLVTEAGTPAPECAAHEGGTRRDGGHDCSHAAVSRYSLDFAAVTLEEGAVSDADAEVRAIADGTVISICLPPVPTATCGPKGPFVVVEHRGGFRAIYAHLNPASVVVRRKMAVTRGQPLGTMVAGEAEPYAWVHFELRFQNQGAGAAAQLGALVLDGRKLTDYRVDPGAPGFYRSTNSGDRVLSPE